MIPMPIVGVTDMDKSVAFYTALGMTVRTRSRSGAWVELQGSRPDGGGELALHIAKASVEPSQESQFHADADEQRVVAGSVGLSFVSRQPLEDLVERLAGIGVRPLREVVDQAYGRSVVVADPDGLVIQINEHDDELYT